MVACCAPTGLLSRSGARNVTAALVNAPGVQAAGGWPSVATTFVVQDASRLGTNSELQYSVNGGPTQTAPLHASAGTGDGSSRTDPISITFGSVVDCSVDAGRRNGGTAAFGTTNWTTVVADAAFDFNAQVPVRRSDADLASMSLTIAL